MNELENQLRRDAGALHRLSASEQAQAQLDARMAMTPQSARPATERRWPVVGAAVAATVVAAVSLFVLRPAPVTESPTPAVAVNPPVDPLSLGLPELARVPLERVSQTAPLEQEWAAIRDDVERARARVEDDLPIRF